MLSDKENLSWIKRNLHRDQAEVDKEKSSWKSNDLSIPLYLNQQIIFDQLATLQGGLSNVQDIKTTTYEENSKQARVAGSTKAGFLNFFSVNFGGGRETRTGLGHQQEMSEQKVYTPASLFTQLRKALEENRLLHKVSTLEELNDLESNQFVEFKALLIKNPVLTTLEWAADIWDLLITPQQEGIPQQLQEQQQKARQLLDAVLKAVTQAGSIEIVGDILGVDGLTIKNGPNCNAKAVFSAQTVYFNDENASQIEDGEFYVVGKTIRVIKSTGATGDSINLLNKTTLGPLDEHNFEEFADGLMKSALSQYELPAFYRIVFPPAIRVVPIAIFT